MYTPITCIYNNISLFIDLSESRREKNKHYKQNNIE